MKLVIQRVTNASVKVNDKIVGQIGKGFMVLLGVSDEDTVEDANLLVKKLCNLRIFSDENGKMNLSIKSIQGELLIISQFTLYADCSSGNRPSFTNAGKPEHAKQLYEYFIEECKKQDLKVEHGIFGEHMQVTLTNDGPVTILLESKK